MRHALLMAFGNQVTACIEQTNSSQIDIFDCYNCIPSQQKSYIKKAGSDPVHFTLLNPSHQDIVFTAVDNCLLSNTDPARCDCAIGNFKRLYFVEIKQVNVGQRSQARKSASQQLAAALVLFRNRLPLQNTELIAVICLKAKQAYPVQNARKAAELVAFKQKYNATLAEGQVANFEE